MGKKEDQQVLQELMYLCSGIMLQAAAKKQSIVQIDLSPAQAIGLGLPSDAGRIMVVIAGGPSIPKLQQALDLLYPTQ